MEVNFFVKVYKSSKFAVKKQKANTIIFIIIIIFIFEHKIKMQVPMKII